MGRLIDADKLKDFFCSETSGTEDVIQDLMYTHGLDYANDINEDVIMAFAKDLLKAVQNVIDTEPTAYDPDKVVEQMEEFRGEMEQFGCSSMLADMIEIVRGGGVDGN